MNVIEDEEFGVTLAAAVGVMEKAPPGDSGGAFVVGLTCPSHPAVMAAGVEAAADAGTGSVSNTRSDIREVDVTVQQAPAYGMRQLRTPAVSAQVRRQRRAQADAIVRGLARSQVGRPAREIRQVLAAALRQVGVRPAAATLDGLAAAVSAGRPAALPDDSQRR